MSFYVERKVIRKIPGTVIGAVPLPKPKLIEGFGTRALVGEICEKKDVSSVLLVTDETIYSLNLHEKIVNALDKHGIKYTIFHEISSEPTIDIVDKGRNIAMECKAEAVVALGGGSVLDSSKIIAAGAKHPHFSIKHYLRKFALAEGGSLPMITIPTTAGTGAECTVGAVVKGEDGTKNSTVVIGLDIMSVILDSELLINAPESITTWCAIDALSHGLEGLLADVDSDEEDIRKSRECVRLIFKNLPILLDDPQNVEARQATLLAAHYGGNAINTQLAGYVHAFAHSIGALYHIPHGKAIAWCLIPVVESQEYMRYEKLAELAKYCDVADEEDAVETASDKLILALEKLLEECGLEKGCDLINKDDYDKLTKMIDADSINYSPSRTLTDNEIRMLLDRIRRGF